MAGYVSDAVIRRLPAYFRYLWTLESKGVKQISSKDLGESMGLTPSQIRQDINSFGGFGRQGYGYEVTELKNHLQKVLGVNQEHRMVIIGAGRIGQALAAYEGFPMVGFRPIAMFDVAAGRDEPGNLPLYPMQELEERLPDLDVSIAILAIPPAPAQEVMDRLYRLGIRAFWNFATVDLKCPGDAVVVNEHLSDSLGVLSYRMQQLGI